MAVPKDVTIAVVEDELAAADAYARRRGWRLTWLKDDLVLLADGKHPTDQSSIRWHADLAGYRAVPPAWTCFQQEGKDPFKRRFPKAGSLPGGASSIFHSAGVHLCAV
jgi:hypothetical protein